MIYCKKRYMNITIILCLSCCLHNQLSDVYRMIHTILPWEHDSLGSYINILLYKVEQSTSVCCKQWLTWTKKSFEIGVNAEWLKEQQHQIKDEAILFLQGKIFPWVSYNSIIGSCLHSLLGVFWLDSVFTLAIYVAQNSALFHTASDKHWEWSYSVTTVFLHVVWSEQLEV